MLYLTRRVALTALAPALLTSSIGSSLPAFAAPGAPSVSAALPGTYALPDGQAKVSATLAVAPGRPGAPPGTRMLDVAMTSLGATKPITRYEVELSKRLHLIAISDDLKTFLHEHGEQPGADGHFRVPMTFPRGGTWHVYADAVPAGLGQQVMRFEADLDGTPPSPQAASAATPPQPTGLDGSDGRYAVRFDALDLRAGQEAQLALHVLRDGTAAPDLTPYLGVAAHAVFIAAADLTYVHAHAAPAAAPAMGGTGAPMKHDMTGMPGMAMPGMGETDGHGAGHVDGHGAMPGMAGAPMRSGTKVTPDLTLHVRAPKAGTYLMWLQFMAGGQVRTVPFVVAVT